ncbi:MAG TPA: DUF2141 domain-containing protein, partial [Xanthomonadales bacterium]|nr:DUF2141 domain-containing protein [Xanthomonadales bacterium]
ASRSGTVLLSPGTFALHSSQYGRSVRQRDRIAMNKFLTLIATLVLAAPLPAQDAPEVDDGPKPQAATTAAPAPMEIQRLPRLTVNVTGLSKTGTVEVSLFDSAENFMKKPFYQESGEPDDEGKLQVTFLNVFEGTYGLVVVHDENGNELYDSGFLGFGAEPVGYSNNARPWFTRPDFEAVSFEVQADLEVTIDME